MTTLNYPQWRFHRTEPRRLVHDPTEEAALGPGWADTPAAFEGPDEAEPHAEAEVEEAGSRASRRRRIP